MSRLGFGGCDGIVVVVVFGVEVDSKVCSSRRLFRRAGMFFRRARHDGGRGRAEGRRWKWGKRGEGPRVVSETSNGRQVKRGTSIDDDRRM